MFFGCALNGEPMNGTEQDWPVKDDEQRKDYPDRNPNATPPFSLRSRIFLLIVFHEHFILWTALERATAGGAGSAALSVIRPSLSICVSFGRATLRGAWWLDRVSPYHVSRFTSHARHSLPDTR